MTLHRTMFLSALALAGCATVQLNPDRVEASQASVRGAEELGPGAYPTHAFTSSWRSIRSPRRGSSRAPAMHARR